MMDIQNSSVAGDMLFTRFGLEGRDKINKALYAATGDFFKEAETKVPKRPVDRATVDKFLLYEPIRRGLGYVA
jgi:hypothetical protein